MNKETPIQHSVMAGVGSRPNIRLFRNFVGGGYVGNCPRQLIGKVLRPARFGLMVGSGDLIGYQILEITPDMVGKKIARFVSIETKTETGVMSQDQKRWRENIIQAGGIAIKCTCAEQANLLIDMWDKGDR